VGVDLLRPKVGQDLDRALAEEVTLEDVAEGRLGVHGKHQHLVPLPRQPVGGRGGKGRLAQASLGAEHDVAALAVLLEPRSQRHGDGTGSRVRGGRGVKPAGWRRVFAVRRASTAGRYSVRGCAAAVYGSLA